MNKYDPNRTPKGIVKPFDHINPNRKQIKTFPSSNQHTISFPYPPQFSRWIPICKYDIDHNDQGINTHESAFHYQLYMLNYTENISHMRRNTNRIAPTCTLTQPENEFLYANKIRKRAKAARSLSIFQFLLLQIKIWIKHKWTYNKSQSLETAYREYISLWYLFRCRMMYVRAWSLQFSGYTDLQYYSLRIYIYAIRYCEKRMTMVMWVCVFYERYDFSVVLKSSKFRIILNIYECLQDCFDWPHYLWNSYMFCMGEIDYISIGAELRVFIVILKNLIICALNFTQYCVL